MVRAVVPKMNLDELFEQKGEVAKAVSEELEKVTFPSLCFSSLELSLQTRDTFWPTFSFWMSCCFV